MTGVQSAAAELNEVKEELAVQVNEAVREAHPWIEALARWGLFAKGLVYLVIGLVALADVLCAGVRATDPRGVLALVGGQPMGRAILLVVAVGLAGYALWRVVQAIVHPDEEGRSFSALLSRASRALSGVVYGGLAYSAIGMMVGSEGKGLPNPLRHWTDRVLAVPGGPILVGLVSAVVIGIGANQLRIAWKASFCGKLHMQALCGWRESGVRVLGRLGHAARGVLFGVIGVFLFHAARESDPGEARGIGESLHALSLKPHGLWLVAAVSIGLAAYGVYMFVEARHRRIEPPAPA